MYSVVLMMALSGGTEAVESCGGRRCNGCDCGGSYGCNGYYGCNGCRGGFGRRGGGCRGCNGCAGWSCQGSSGYARSWGCQGCSGCAGSGGRVMYYGYSGAPVQGYASAASNAAPASIVVNLPADARLTVNGQASTSTSSRREFETWPLQPGGDYYCTFRMEVDRDGQTIQEERQVAVRPGQSTEVTFNLAPQGVTSR